MDKKLELQIEKNLQEEKKEIEMIEKSIESINEKLIEKVPDRFSRRDIVNAMFGSLILGLTFILKGATASTAVNLHWIHIELIIVVTIIILFAEIYFISYTRVKDKQTRKLGEFITKRLFVMYGISIVTSFFLVYLFNLNNNPIISSFYNVLKLVVLLSFPCAVGAAVPSLLKKY